VAGGQHRGDSNRLGEAAPALVWCARRDGSLPAHSESVSAISAGRTRCSPPAAPLGETTRPYRDLPDRAKWRRRESNRCGREGANPAISILPQGIWGPWWVEKDFRAYLRCGILAHGFAGARCEDCGHERLIPFSCKGRGICPSCNTRRIALPHATYVARGPRGRACRSPHRPRAAPSRRQAVGPLGAQAPPALPASQPRHRGCRPPGPRFARCPPTRHPHHAPPRQPRRALGRPTRGRQLPAPPRLLPQRPSPLPPGRPRRRLLPRRRR